MPQLNRAIRRALAYGLYYTGLLWLYAAIRLRRKAVVLMYHRVLPAGADAYSHAGIVVSPATFEMHLEFLSRHFRPLTQTEFRRQLEASSFDRRACLVTFDDGWWDNVEYALPALKKHAVPAIFFVATRYIGSHDTFWQERLTRLLCIAARQPGAADGLLREAGLYPAARLSPASVRQRAREFVTTLKTREPAVARGYIERLEEALRDLPESRSLGADRFMTWDEVGTLHHSGRVTIGSHAHSHTRLTTLGYQGARDELERSRTELAAHGIPDSIACAYPNGDVNDPVEAAAVDAGFRLGFGTRNGFVRHSSEATHLRRINIHDADAGSRPEFLYRILGLP